MNYRWMIWLILLSGCQSEVVQQAAPVRPVKYLTLSSGQISETATFTGITQSDQEATLSFKVGGVIENVVVKDGQRVLKGQLIAALDDEDYSLQVEQAKVQVKQAETSLNVARSTYARVERLYENNSVSLSEFEQAKGNFEASTAQLEAAQKQLEAAQNQVRYTQLRAPFTGLVSSLGVEAGELVGAGSPVGILSSEGQPEVTFGVAGSYVGLIKAGQKVTISLSILPDQVFDGEITEVAFSQGNAATYPARARFLKPIAAIRPGLSAEIQFPLTLQTGNAQPLLIPAKAVRENAEGKRFVFQLKGTGDTLTVSETPVELGMLSAAGFVLKSGLAEGDRIVTAGLNALLDGMSVTLLP
ncbi:MAG: efflux RND transporter periplasmic adaptor subunit [Bacteroidia bacterium]|nr:efflux RND transporter periplasmic adaptor subunit [Bacteroidia bacterium]